MALAGKNVLRTRAKLERKLDVIIMNLPAGARGSMYVKLYEELLVQTHMDFFNNITKSLIQSAGVEDG